MNEPTEQDYLTLERKLMAATRLVAVYESERELRGGMTLVAYAVLSGGGVMVGLLVGWLAHGLWG